jgi:alpha-N-acetylglucosaminidase
MAGTLSRRQAIAGASGAGLLAAAPALASDRSGIAAARGVLTRLFGPRARAVGLSLEPSGAGAWYESQSRAGALSVRGDTPVALARGAYAWLKARGYAHISWDGNRYYWPGRLPDSADGPVASPFRHRAYLNTCTYGYTTPWWGWARWRREIDWMAVHGIDMPLALEGQEFVWRALWREEGLSEAELAQYFSGPAFTPWQRMGNLEGYLAPLPAAWIDKKHDLQRKILAAMRALGMQPILPAFGGYVPKAFALKHPAARIYRMSAGPGFHETYWLDPGDPLFARLAGRFLALYDQTYGPGTYYLADSFNEMTPPIAQDGSDPGGAFNDAAAASAAARTVDPALKASRLAAYGKAIWAAFAQARPHAVWVMQGWLFGADQAFWTPDAIAAYLSGIPDDRLMVLDIGNDRYADIWKKAKAFGGKRWVYGYVHNYGASNPLYGDLAYYRADLAAIAASPDKRRLEGFGLFPEGLHNNAIVYAAAYDLAWSDGAGSLPAWLAGYARSRYGVTTPALEDALGKLVEAAYSTRYWTPRWWRNKAGAYLFCKRPTTAIVAFEGHPGDRAKLKAAVRDLARAPPALFQSDLFDIDLVDAARHLASEEIDLLLMRAVAAYRRGDRVEADAARRKIEDLALAADALMGVRCAETLGQWIDQARAYGDTAAEARAYVRNAKAQITVWGGQGNLADYASKAWQGMYADFYQPRWARFLDALRMAGAGPFDEAAVVADIVAWEQAWVAQDKSYVRKPPATPITDVLALLARLDEA